MRICIVDDNTLVCEALALALADTGHDVVFAATGAVGIDIATSSSLDVAVIDYDLPDMKGDAVAAAIRSAQPNLPIVLASGWYSPAANLDAIVDLFLQKPFTPRTLIAAVETAQARRAAA